MDIHCLQKSRIGVIQRQYAIFPPPFSAQKHCVPLATSDLVSVTQVKRKQLEIKKNKQKYINYTFVTYEDMDTIQWDEVDTQTKKKRTHIVFMT